MSEEMVLAASARPLEDIFLAARNSQELECCRGQLAEWLGKKLACCKSESRNLAEAVANAKKHKWASKVLETALGAAKRRVKYYEKVLAATQAGYTMIPYFWSDMFAVRVKRKSATMGTSSANYDYPGIPRQCTDNPALGEGQYVSAQSLGSQWSKTVLDEKGKEITKYFSQSEDFMDVEFPLVAAKPELMSATAQAMTGKFFDEIGIVPSRKGRDPFIIGRIKGPSGKNCSFLIAWYLDTRAL